MSEPKTGRGALFTGGLAAILASACCLGPLVLIALGCRRRSKSEPPCRPNIEPGVGAGLQRAGGG
ncbi:hypothetical protein E0W60_36610 (plasmid) [Cupriavidus oxalaticus]|uniref:Mercuric transport protein MerT n=1 Tax=Cupriavidus oxalaticus TaxID=96344 RepID=A0A4P7LL23_9BURK|nr:hypothetical protein E0W60_36610 [Cupriavidus oxalaticus]